MSPELHAYHRAHAQYILALYPKRLGKHGLIMSIDGIEVGILLHLSEGSSALKNLKPSKAQK